MKSPPVAFWLGLVVTVAFVPQWHLGSVSLRWAVLSVTLPVLAAFATRGMRYWPWAFVPVAVAAVSISWTPVVYDGVGALLPLFVITLAALWGASLGDDGVECFWHGVIIGLIPSLIVGGFELMRVPLWDTNNTGATGLFVNRLIFGQIAALALVAVFALRLRWECAIIPALCIVEVMLWHGSREAVLSAAVGFIALTFHRGRRIEALMLVVMVVVAVVPLVMFYRFDSAMLRIGVWNDVVNNLRWLGHGLGSFDQLYPIIATRSTLVAVPGHVHNDLLEYVFELGLLALPIFVVIALAAQQSHRREWPVFWVIMVQINVSFPLHMPVTALVAGLILGRLFRRRSWERNGAYLVGHDLQPGMGTLDRARSAAGFGGGVGSLSILVPNSDVASSFDRPPHPSWHNTDFVGPEHGAGCSSYSADVAVSYDCGISGVQGFERSVRKRSSRSF